MSRDWRDVSLRLGLIGLALILFAIAWDIWMHGEAFRDPLSLLLGFLVLLFGMGALILALVRGLPDRAAWLVLAGTILATLGSAYLAYRTYTPLTTSHTDNEMIAQFAVESLESGEDPYAWNYADMLRVFRDQGVNYTPFLDGAFQHRLTYPALPTLLYLGLDGLGLDLGQGEARVAGLIAFIALLILLFVGAPQLLRPLIVLPLFVYRDLLSWPLNGVQDVVWAALLVGMIYTWKRPLWRAVLYGLACSFRQQPWFVAPFLLIYLWHHQEGTPRQRLRPVAFFALVSAGVFVVTNLPFIVWDPGAWLQGALEPAYAAFNYLSHGPGILTEYGIVALPRQFYTALQASSFAIMLIVYGFYAPVIGQGFWIFPGLFFWFYYRGLPSYWAYWIPVVLAAVAGGAARAFTSGWRLPQAARRPKHAVPATLVAGILIANFAWAGTLLAHGPQVEVGYSPPIETFYTELANRLRVTVHNRSDRVLTPRFAVRPDYGVQALPWRIVSGPDQLGPGEAGEYVIDAKTMASRGFRVARGAQLVVTDAGGDYALRATLDVPAQTRYEDPDQIANPDYLYWPQDGPAPLEWALMPSQGAVATTRLRTFEGRTALSIEATGDPTSGPLPLFRVQQTVTFPERFAIWVYRTSAAMDPAESVYGIEVDDGDHRLWILFGESDGEATPTSGNRRTVYRRALLDAWSLETIDLRALYAQLGWPEPLPSLRLARGVRYAVPQVKLSLIAGTSAPGPTQWLFGPIDQDGSAASPGALVDYALQHPGEYYVDVGDKYRTQRNYGLAQDAYAKALGYDAANSAAYFGLGESAFWLGNYVQARGAFEQALALGYPRQGEARKGMGWSEYNLGNYQAAIPHFEAAASAFVARDNPDDKLSLADAYNGLGWSWIQLGDCGRATPNFNQALDLAPALPGAIDGLALCQSHPD
jgi:uncharacterized membrane protein